jgi:hypothetical protein
MLKAATPGLGRQSSLSYPDSVSQGEYPRTHRQYMIEPERLQMSLQIPVSEFFPQ